MWSRRSSTSSRTDTAPPHPIRRIALRAILLLAVAAGCDDAPPGSGSVLLCDEDADPHFLRSKTDDDDGDGILFDEDFPSIDDEDDDIADHAWIRDDYGVYHLFFHSENRGGNNAIEHYVSADLHRLRHVGAALRTNPDGWDSHLLWAPHVVKSGSLYFMFYTGVDGPAGDPSSAQRIGLAVSTDLMTWRRYPANRCPGTAGDGCVYACAECWTTGGREPAPFDRQCRDPFVAWDPAGKRWVMFATARSTNGSGVVTVACSADLVEWVGEGFIDATRRLETGIGAQTTGGQAENPHVVTRDGTHYLFFTDWWDPEDSVGTVDPRTITQYVTSPVLAADSLGSPDWTWRGYIPDPGVNAIEILRPGDDRWIMSQSISNERSGYWSSRRQLRLKCILWGDDLTFETANVRFDRGAGPRSPLPTAAGAAR